MSGMKNVSLQQQQALPGAGTFAVLVTNGSEYHEEHEIYGLIVGEMQRDTMHNLWTAAEEYREKEHKKWRDGGMKGTFPLYREEAILLKVAKDAGYEVYIYSDFERSLRGHKELYDLVRDIPSMEEFGVG
jgi:hypothetical protein